jgi:hypothetical protein
MNEHTSDCKIHDDGSCCDCGVIESKEKQQYSKEETNKTV